MSPIEQAGAEGAVSPEAEGSQVQEEAPVADEHPEHVPVNAWVTMGIFAVFVIAFGTCASTFMFN